MKRLPLYLPAILISGLLGAAVSRFLGRVLFLSSQSEVITLGVVLSLVFAVGAIALVASFPKK